MWRKWLHPHRWRRQSPQIYLVSIYRIYLPGPAAASVGGTQILGIVVEGIVMIVMMTVVELLERLPGFCKCVHMLLCPHIRHYDLSLWHESTVLLPHLSTLTARLSLLRAVLIRLGHMALMICDSSSRHITPPLGFGTAMVCHLRHAFVVNDSCSMCTWNRATDDVFQSSLGSLLVKRVYSTYPPCHLAALTKALFPRSWKHGLAFAGRGSTAWNIRVSSGGPPNNRSPPPRSSALSTAAHRRPICDSGAWQRSA
mmetsp:Transcript_17446/g.52337  ORF Transcript_17446/g.52337 Transcript_17446/m.52337 type:complete len:255 (-) Transcript_17446:63-827(-)